MSRPAVLPPNSSANETGFQRLVRALALPASYPHAVSAVQTVETHISWVFLTGTSAYKLKKPVDLGFLDFSTPAKRLHACREELRLNRRLAPDLYLEVVGFRGTPEAPEIVPVPESPASNGGAPPFEYAVRMREFPQEAQLDRRLDAGLLGREETEAIAARIAAFHAELPGAGEDVPYGTPERIHAPARENFAQVSLRLPRGADDDLLERLRLWSERAYDRLAPRLAARKRDGFVRECHGDLHLSNLVELESGVTAFDCLEFDPALRWIDVISEVAFLAMDFQVRGRDDLAHVFLNTYLEETGDYRGLALLRYYLAYRSMVRAKVAAILLSQAVEEQGEAAAAEHPARARYERHIELARRTVEQRRPALLVTCGVSGSGKSANSARLVGELPALRVRSDYERKRLHGRSPHGSAGDGVERGLYSPDASLRTYAVLEESAREIVKAGYTAIVDAACLRREQRERFRGLADELGVPLLYLSFGAEERVLRARVERRHAAGTDASDADVSVLEHQLRNRDPLDPEERRHAIRVRTDEDVDARALAWTITSRLRDGR
jgi:aminoglycoside phosphotransferase family enzyme/gluconate kinase